MTLKTGVMAAENAALPRNKLHFKMYYNSIINRTQLFEL